MNEIHTQLVPIWIYEIKDLPEHRDNCIVKLKYCYNLEVFDAYIPATVREVKEDTYDLSMFKTDVVDGNVSCFTKVYRYNRNNLPELFSLEYIVGIDYYKIRDGYLVKYNKNESKFELFPNIFKYNTESKFVKWFDLFDDWRIIHEKTEVL